MSENLNVKKKQANVKKYERKRKKTYKLEGNGRREEGRKDGKDKNIYIY